MESIAAFPQSVDLNTPSIWFWLKAGLGFGAGLCIAATAFWLLYSFVIVTFILSSLRALAHR